MGNPIVFFDIKIGGKHAGRLLMELFADTTPKVAENFRAFCTGEKMGKNGKPLHYKGLSPCVVFKDWFYVMSDTDETVYGEMPLETENQVKKFTGPGDLAMVNNSPSFQISLLELEYEDNVVFGKVFSGMDVLMAIESVGSDNGKPTKSVTIVDCGQLHDDDDDDVVVAEEEEEPY